MNNAEPSTSRRTGGSERHGEQVERHVEVTNRLGLHARPAATFAETAARFESVIRVTHGDREADAKSVLLLLALDVRQGDHLVIHAQGRDAAAAVEALAALVAAP